MEKLRKIGFSKLTPIDDALNKIFSKIQETSVEDIDIREGLNRILAKDIVSESDVPPFDRSAMDGYAIKAENSFSASFKTPKTIKLIGTVEIGESAKIKIEKSEGCKISTGAPLPEGADAVIKIEDTEIENDVIKLYTSLVPGKNISKKGEDIKKGTQVLSKGIDLKAEHIALLSSLGLNNIEVKIKPRVSIFSLGDELVEPGDTLKPGKIFNSNNLMISTLVNLYGGFVKRAETFGDDKSTIKQNLIEAVKDSQVLIFTGGTSVGTKDYLPEIINELGTILIHGIAMRPGSPTLLGLFNDTLIFCLPGTPVAAYISFLKVAGPAIRKMLGCSLLDPRNEIPAIIDKDVPVSSLGILHYLRVKIEEKNNTYVAYPIKLKGSAIITSLIYSDGIVEITPNQEGLKKGERVIVKLFPK